MGARPMPQYIMLVNFTDQGLRGVKDVPNRQDKSRETAKQFGVERKTVWMTFGPYDFVHLYEAPNDEAMAKFVMTIASFGNCRDWKSSQSSMADNEALRVHLAPRRGSGSHGCRTDQKVTEGEMLELYHSINS